MEEKTKCRQLYCAVASSVSVMMNQNTVPLPTVLWTCLLYTSEIEDEPAGDEEDDIRTDEPVLLPAEGGIPVVVDGLDDIGLPDETPTPDSGVVKADEHFERTYLFWLSESDEADGGLPYACLLYTSVAVHADELGAEDALAVVVVEDVPGHEQLQELVAA